jgi:hypothetical protein
MHCPRCDGLMVGEYFSAPLIDTYYGFQGHRCLNCGAIVDGVIEANHVSSVPVVRHARPPEAAPRSW